MENLWIYPEATCLQDPRPEANLVKFEILIIFLARDSNVTIANEYLQVDRRL